MYSYKEIFQNKQNILFVTAHPDDVIVYFGALIYKLRQDNKNVFVITVTNGARGSRENIISEEILSKKRTEEEIAALKILGVPKKNTVCLNFKDGEVESNLALIGKISRYIRKWKVNIVGTHEPSMQYLMTYDKSGYFIQHRDHRKVGEATIDAVYPFSRDMSFFPEYQRKGYATNATGLLFEFLSEVGFRKISTQVHVANEPSYRILRKFMNEKYIHGDHCFFEKYLA